MKKRFSKPGRRRRTSSTGQGRQRLRKTIHELYPADGLGNADGDGWSEDALETLDELAGPVPKSGPVRRHRKLSAAASDATPPYAEDATAGVPARVVALSSGSCSAIDNDGTRHDCKLPSRLARDQRSRIAAGDRVTLRWDDDEVPWVDTIEPRTTVLSRPDPLNPREERVIAANVDVVVHVHSVVQPPLRPALIDRYLIAIERSGALPVLCINKIDLINNVERRDVDTELAPYRSQGLPIVYCSVKTCTGLEQLRQHLRNRLGVFVGHSGVGKSSLLNALAAESRAVTGAISLRHGTGRHTTTGSALHRLPGSIEIIDTPGIRELGLWRFDVDALLRAFPEIETLSRDCRFSNCAHDGEPGCAVVTAVATGTLPAARHALFRRLRDSLT